jgi:hypothetical protein
MRSTDPESQRIYELIAARKAEMSLAIAAICNVFPSRRTTTLDLGPIEYVVSGFKAL